MSRWKAGAIHFGISSVIVAALLAIILLVWYPGILFSIDGGWTGLQIIIGVDLVLGPLLTLVVFKVDKPGLKFDLSCIAVAQISCLLLGSWIVYNERPIALILAYDTFYSVATQEYETFGKDPEVLERFPGPYPKMIYIELPENEFSAEVANMRSQFIGDPLYMKTDDYRALPQTAEDWARIFRKEQTVRDSVSEALNAQLEEDCRFSKFISAVTSGYVCFDPVAYRLSQFYGNEYLRGEGG